MTRSILTAIAILLKIVVKIRRSAENAGNYVMIPQCGSVVFLLNARHNPNDTIILDKTLHNHNKALCSFRSEM